MKGRVNSTIWMLVLVNVVAMAAMLGLGYGAGAWRTVCPSWTR